MSNQSRLAALQAINDPQFSEFEPPDQERVLMALDPEMGKDFTALSLQDKQGFIDQMRQVGKLPPDAPFSKPPPGTLAKVGKLALEEGLPMAGMMVAPELAVGYKAYKTGKALLGARTAASALGGGVGALAGGVASRVTGLSEEPYSKLKGEVVYQSTLGGASELPIAAVQAFRYGKAKAGEKVMEKIVNRAREKVNPEAVEASQQLIKLGTKYGKNLKGTPGLNLEQMTEDQLVDIGANIGRNAAASSQEFVQQVIANRQVTKAELDEISKIVASSNLDEIKIGNLIKEKVILRSKSIENKLTGGRYISGDVGKETLESIGPILSQFDKEAGLRYTSLDEMTKGGFVKDAILGTEKQVTGLVDINNIVKVAKGKTAKAVAPSVELRGAKATTTKAIPPSISEQISPVSGVDRLLAPELPPSAVGPRRTLSEGGRTMIVRQGIPSVTTGGQTAVVRQGQKGAFPRLLTDDGARVMKYLSKLPGDIPFSEAHWIRSDLLKMKRGIEKTNPSDSVLSTMNSVIKQIDGAMEKAAKNLKGPALVKWRAANAFYKEGAEKYLNKTINKLLISEPETVAKVLVENSDPIVLRKLKKVFENNPAAWQNITNSYLDNMVEVAKGSEEFVDPARLISLMQKKKAKQVQKLILGESEQQVFEEIIRNTKNLKGFMSKVLKESNSESLAQYIFSEKKFTPLRVVDKLFDTSPQARGEVMRSYIDMMVGKATTIDKSNRSFINGRLLKESIEQQKLKMDIVFKGKPELRKRFTKIADTIMQVESKNPESIGAMMIQMKQAGAITQGASALATGTPTGVASAAIQAGAFIGIPQLFTKIITNKNATKWMVEGFKAEAGSKIQITAVGKLMKFLTGAAGYTAKVGIEGVGQLYSPSNEFAAGYQ